MYENGSSYTTEESANQYDNFEGNLVMLSEAEKEMAAHSGIPAWRTPGTEEPGRLQSLGSQRVRRDCDSQTHTHGEAEDASILPMPKIPECPCTLNPKRCANTCRFYYCLWCQLASLSGQGCTTPILWFAPSYDECKAEDTEILHILTWNGPNILIHMEPIFHRSNTADRGDIHK